MGRLLLSCCLRGSFDSADTESAGAVAVACNTAVFDARIAVTFRNLGKY